MEPPLASILFQELGERTHASEQILGLGSVNQVFLLKGTKGEYILRLNSAQEKGIEFRKEAWCQQKARALGIPCPELFAFGELQDWVYLLMEYLPGKNGSQCTGQEQISIWQKLGCYAKKVHQIPEWGDSVVAAQEFHANWQARLSYNLARLNSSDSLLREQGLNPKLHRNISHRLQQLRGMNLNVGLVHGDLCPRNTLVNQDEVYLLDWGTAQINVIPHLEMVQVMNAGEANTEAWEAFLDGMGFSLRDFESIQHEVQLIHLLHSIDTYRWAETYAKEHLNRYFEAILRAMEGAHV